MKEQKSKRKSKSQPSAVVYLTKRTVLNASRSAIRKASVRAMNIAGYVIKASNGWIIRENKDGSIKKIKRYKTVNQSTKIVLD